MGSTGVTISPPINQNKVTVTVSNSLTTLTIGGAIGDSGNGDGLAKSGSGNLVLLNNLTYTGETIASEGILDVRVASGLANSSAIEIGGNGTLRLENADNGGSAWDFAALSALNANLRAGLDAGTVANLSFAENVTGYTDVTATPDNPNSTAYWDGSDSTGDADGGAGTWDNSTNNWDDAATGGSSISWDADSTSNDTAVFGGSSGEVALGANVDVRRVEVNTELYQIGSNDESHFLNFGSIEPRMTFAESGTVKAGITGSPDVHYQESNANKVLLFDPTADVTMNLGVITRLSDDQVHLGGTGTGHTLQGCPRDLSSDSRSKVLKVGTSTWTCNGEFYGGSYYWVQGGTLIVNGLSHARSPTNCRLYDGATLIVNGTLEDFVYHTGGNLGGNAIVNQSISVPANGVLAPGYPTGTMTVTNDCTIDGTLEINIDGEQHGRLAVDLGSTLTITNATLEVSATGDTPANAVSIATYGTLTGEFATVNGLDSSWSIDYSYGGNAIALIPPLAKGTIVRVE